MTINLYEGEKLWKETDNQENTELLNLARKKRGQKGLLFLLKKLCKSRRKFANINSFHLKRKMNLYSVSVRQFIPIISKILKYNT